MHLKQHCSLKSRLYLVITAICYVLPFTRRYLASVVPVVKYVIWVILS